MRKHSLFFKTMTVFVALAVSVFGAKFDAFAYTTTETSHECPRGLCSKNLMLSGPYQGDDILDSNIPSFGGVQAKILYSNPSIDISDVHLFLTYCPSFSSSNSSFLRHNFTYEWFRHKYTIEYYENVSNPSSHIVHYKCTGNGTFSEFSNSKAGENATIEQSELEALVSSTTGCGKTKAVSLSHRIQTGEWSKVDNTKHTRTKTCADCGYQTTETANHTWTYGSYTSVNGTQHKVVKTCSSCNYSENILSDHNLSYGSWTQSATTHSRTISCSVCPYTKTETQAHSFNTTYTYLSNTEHRKDMVCNVCGYSKSETEGHSDNNGDDICDECGYSLTRFSVTVPTSLTIVMDKNGKTYTASNAAIYNNSTGSVSVKQIKIVGQNGWTVVPYRTNMANEKVDSKKIGLKILGFETDNNGKIQITNQPVINKGSNIPLPYSAVVSATSSPINNTEVLKVYFVIDWSEG